MPSIVCPSDALHFMLDIVYQNQSWLEYLADELGTDYDADIIYDALDEIEDASQVFLLYNNF